MFSTSTLCFRKDRETTHASRDTLCKTPPPPGTISCLARLLGEKYDSGRNPSLDGEANLGVLTGHPRTNGGKSREPLPFPESGLIIGDISLSSFQQTTFASRERNHNWAQFFVVHFLSEHGFALVSSRRACYRLVWPFSILMFSP